MNLRDPQSLLYLLQDDLEFSNWQLDAPNGAPGPTTMNRKLLRAKGVATNGARTLRTLSKLKVETRSDRTPPGRPMSLVIEKGLPKRVLSPPKEHGTGVVAVTPSCQSLGAMENSRFSGRKTARSLIS